MTTENIPQTTLAYVAGLFDGEGSIVIGVSKRRRKRGIVPDHWLQVGIGMCDKPIIDWLHETFGGHVTMNGKTRQQGAKRQSWCWRVMSNEAVRFLSLIQPFLRGKAEQASLAVEFQIARSAPRLTKFVDDALIENREEFRRRLRALTMGSQSATAWV